MRIQTAAITHTIADTNMSRASTNALGIAVRIRSNADPGLGAPDGSTSNRTVASPEPGNRSVKIHMYALAAITQPSHRATRGPSSAK